EADVSQTVVERRQRNRGWPPIKRGIEGGEQVAAALIGGRRAMRELAGGFRAHARAPHDLRRAIADAEPELVPSFAVPRRRPLGAVERELDFVSPPGRRLRQNARPLQSAGESDQKAGVILGLAAVQVAELRDD